MLTVKQLKTCPYCWVSQNHLHAEVLCDFLKLCNIFQLYLTLEFFWKGDSQDCCSSESTLGTNHTKSCDPPNNMTECNVAIPVTVPYRQVLIFAFLVLSITKKCLVYSEQWITFFHESFVRIHKNAKFPSTLQHNWSFSLSLENLVRQAKGICVWK